MRPVLRSRMCVVLVACVRSGLTPRADVRPAPSVVGLLRPQAAKRMTLDSFRELFRERPPKRFGPVWHMWHLFLAVLPAITIAVVCTHVEKTRLKELELSTEEVCA